MIARMAFISVGSGQIIPFSFGENIDDDQIMVASSWRLEQNSLNNESFPAGIKISLYASEVSAALGIPFGNGFYSQEQSSGSSLTMDVDMLDTFIIGNHTMYLRIEATEQIECRFSLVGKMRRGTETELAQVQFGEVLVV